MKQVIAIVKPYLVEKVLDALKQRRWRLAKSAK